MQPRIAIVGAGIIGLSTAYALRERGADCTVFERGMPGNGQSGGESRIFRHAHDDLRLIELAKRARQIWDVWSDALGCELVSPDGAVALGRPAEQRLALLREAGDIEARQLDTAELAELVPVLAAFDGFAMIDEGGGAIRTTAAIEALSSVIGDSLIVDEVLSLQNRDEGVELRAGGRTEMFDSVVVCAGRESAALARGVGLELPVELSAHVRLTFAVKDVPPSRLPCLQDSSGEFGEQGIYAAPVPCNGAFAVGLSETTPVGAEATALEPSSLARLAARASRYVERALPGLDPAAIEPRHCWVTTLPWSDDGFAVWSSGQTHVVAGHNLFKQAPALGRELAGLAAGDPLPSQFRPDAKLGGVGSESS